MKKLILLLFVATCFVSCTKDAAATLDPNGGKSNNSNSVQRSPTMDPDGKNLSTTQSANGDAGIGADPFGKK
jgi:hypothetical protein